MKDELLTIKEAANYLKATPATVTRWCREGTLPSRKFGKVWRVSSAGIARMVTVDVNAAVGRSHDG